MKKFYTLFIIFFTCSCWFNVAFAQEVVIVRVPDAALSTALRKALGLAPTALITKQAMSRLTTLNAAGDQQDELPISDLTGLEHAAQLEILILYWNQQISDLSPISGLKRLRELHLGANQIRDISPIAGLTQLEKLALYGNQISDISPLAGLKRLRELHLSTNQISDISPLAGLKRLRELHLSTNQISDISPITGLKQLRWLFLGANQIRDISPIAGLTQLETLYISNNQIRGVNPLAGLVNLKKLVIAGNPVRDASLLANLTKLVEVDIEIPHQVRAGGVISDRHLASAVRAALRLTNIQPITKERMQGLRRLLITENYKVSSLAGLEYATYLEELVFNRTQIGGDLSPLENLTQLKRLDLGYSQISDISPLANLTNLTYLNLQSNQISDISPLANLTQLEFLWLVHNRISDISPLANLRRLTRLGLYNNRIRGVSPLAGLVNLEELFIGNNPIEDASPLAVLPKLRDVDIDIPLPPVRLGISDRPPIYWIEGGSIYALVGADVQKFAPSVDNALNLTVAGGKVYWTEKTGESAGTINSANLNGSGVTELASILAVPMGIAVDTAASKLYWTNSRGRIQSANLNGSGIKNVIQNLASPLDLALAGGNAYWTQGGNVRFVNLRGQKQIRNISTGTDTAGSLAIGGGKVYWTERTGDSGGTINSANLNGTGTKQLASILAAPMGIAVDGARSKLYWTNSRGRVQSANLDGSRIQNVVDGLGSPGDMVLSNSLKAPAATTATTPTAKSTTTAGTSKYDVDSSGTVDNVDVFLIALAVGTSNTKYDVNKDGTVDDKDIALVRDNRDAGAAGAPMVVGVKLTAEQMGRLQAQIDLLVATHDRSPAAIKTRVYLQQLIATARPEKTQLLANYPNPFNPETWIPYELATDTDVRLTIYASNGVVVRRLTLGHQTAGYYTDRDRAAYWDGRNALGEQVASGLYFYQLETDDLSSLRKMVILK